MKKGKQILALVLALVLLVCLAACGGSSGSSGDNTNDPGPSDDTGSGNTGDTGDTGDTLPTAEEFVARWGLEGKWSLYAWDMTTGGYYTEETDDFYIFTKTSVTYLNNNVESGTWNLTVTGENSLDLTGPTATSWTIAFDKENGDLLITDPGSSLIYRCVPAAENTAPALPTPYYTHVVAIDPIRLEGKWNITGWTVKSDGTFVPVTGQAFAFEEARLGYYIGDDLVSVSGYYFDDEYNIGLRSEGADRSETPETYWTLSLDPLGRLLVEDPDYSIIYLCEKIPFVPENNFLPGRWKVDGWVTVSSGEYVPLEEEGFFLFTETGRSYLLNGETIQNNCPYEWKDETTIAVTMDGVTSKLTVSLTEDGELRMASSDGSLLFHCTPVEETDGETGGETGGEEPAELPLPFYTDAIPVTLEELQGKWAITGWIVMADSSFTSAENQAYVFEGNLLKYYVDDVLTSVSTVYFDDQYNLGLRAEGAAQDEAPDLYWTTYKNVNGQLLIEDPRSSVLYVCQFVVPEPEVDPTIISPETLLGDWVITGFTRSGVRTELDYEAVFFFTEDTRYYYVNGKLSTMWTYVWEDEDTIIVSMSDGDHACDLFYNEAGLFCITDPRYGDLYYTCYRK